LQKRLKAELPNKEADLAALDSDVAAVARRCLGGELRPTEKVVLCDLVKKFGGKPVVREVPLPALHSSCPVLPSSPSAVANRQVKGLNFALSENECFALLGHNGAGKSIHAVARALGLPLTDLTLVW
jgi:hypothetical protein